MSSNWSDQSLQSDLLLVAQPDTKKPFASKQDAFDRLLPYHIFASGEPKRKLLPALDRARSLIETVESARKRLKSVHESLVEEEQAEEFRDVCELCYLESSLIQQEKVIFCLSINPSESVFRWPPAHILPRYLQGLDLPASNSSCSLPHLLCN